MTPEEAREAAAVTISRLELELAEALEWPAMLSGWGGTPEIVNEFIKGQQVRIHAAQDLEKELAEVREQRDRLAQVIEAATVLIAAKGRHNTMLAHEGLRAAVKDCPNDNNPATGSK